MSYQPKVYRKQGGNELVVASGGKITLEAGATLEGHGLAGNAAVAADALAIPLTAAHVSKTTGSDAEALTLADGTPGQILTITLTTDGGGDGTLTPTTKTGFATIVFADAGDSATLRYVDDTVGWVIMGLHGVSAAPVKTV